MIEIWVHEMGHAATRGRRDEEWRTEMPRLKTLGLPVHNDDREIVEDYADCRMKSELFRAIRSGSNAKERELCGFLWRLAFWPRCRIELQVELVFQMASLHR